MAQAPSAPVKNAIAKTTRPKARAKVKPSPVPEPPQPPPPPPTPEQMPPAPPQVTYKNGLLTIIANNSTLGDILHAVSVHTGATVDAPGNLTSERVATRIGPGSPRDVLAMLLEGPRFQYVLVGSGGDPNAVRSIILTPSAGAPAAPSSPAPGAFQAGARTPAPPREETEEEIQADEQVGPEAQQPPPMQQMMQQPYQGEGRAAFPNPQQQQQGQQQQGQQQVKTPEQLLEELRRLQQPGGQPNVQPGTTPAQR